MSNQAPNPKPLFDKSIMIYFGVITLVLLVVMTMITPDSRNSSFYMSYDQFVASVVDKNVKTVILREKEITGETFAGERFTTVMPDSDPGLMDDLLNNGVEIHQVKKEEPSFIWSWMPTLLLIAVIIWMVRRTSKQMGAGGKGGGMFGDDDKSKELDGEKMNITFDDIAGIPEAKEELEEIVQFVKNPERFNRLGGKVPCGVLLEGDPGNGKTLLAKATAGEAGVPFFYISGSDFVEKFVGVGAGRVRAMFEKARKAAPCIIFIDEFDAVGKQRSSGMGSNDEREQTINQLLVEMDGFESNPGIIVLAATNRSDLLDKALVRPGRFDRKVNVPYPDMNGRCAILQVHARKVPLDPEVNLDVIAKGCVGMSGADLANLVNEAALFAARDGGETVEVKHFEKAKDKVMMGGERKSMIMTDDEKKLTAYHEAGHAIVGMTVPEHDEVHKVSIMPRGRALGVTMYQPEQDRVSYSEQRLDSQLLSLMGGRAAEELIFGEKAITTGASNDIERCTGLAKQMVEQWGFSDLGPGYFAKDPNSYSENRSPEMVAKVEAEIEKKVNGAYEGAKKILTEKMDILESMTAEILEHETIDAEAVKRLMGHEDA